ncbi:MAG: MCP four helix bundle domain-containing protein, partial [Desulfamplus sp.]|nr:MCP four helix bundle domain-containing protein [Desulfamplus sp.]
MKIADIKIGTKLYVSFTLVVLIFAGIIAYQVFQMHQLGQIQDAGAKRAEDSISVFSIREHFGDVYSVVADAIINRNMEETVKNLDQIKQKANTDITMLYELVDTAEEKSWAAEFEKEYRGYLDLFEKQMLPILLKGDSVEARLKDALEIKKIAQRADGVYPVVADAVINRDLEATRKEFEVLKEQAVKDIASVKRLVDTDIERAAAENFATHYGNYLGLFENQMLPILSQGDSADMIRIRALDEEIDKMREATLKPLDQINASLENEALAVSKDEARIRELDGQIDQIRDAAGAMIFKILESLKAESVEGDKLYDAIAAQIRTVSISIALAGILLALLFAWLSTQAITRPVNACVAAANKIAA